MAIKPYDNEDAPLSIAAEPTTAYGYSVPNDNAVLSTFGRRDTYVKNTKKFDEQYEKLKAEADEIFGVKELSTADEFFGKVRHIVNGLYEQL